MTKDEIIVLLKEQLQLANEQLQQANTTVSSLTLQVNELIIRIKSLEELLVQKGIAIDKVNRQNKALGKLVSGKKSERQEKNPQDSMTQEEFDKKKEEQAEKRNAKTILHLHNKQLFFGSVGDYLKSDAARLFLTEDKND